MESLLLRTWLLCLLIIMVRIDGAKQDLDAVLLEEMHFTRMVYNATIPENSLGKTYITPEEKIGIPCPDKSVTVQYKIVAGDGDKLFKTEERFIGNFWFLLIRIKTGNTYVLNRERKDKYNIEVKGLIYKGDNTKDVLLERKTNITIRVLDTNDLTPLFYPTEYEETVNEDTPIHTSVAIVLAEDADLGINGEIYYSLTQNTEYFAIHPTTGVITLTRRLVYLDKSKHELTIFAQDRGMILRGQPWNKTSSARLTVLVRQVNLYDPEIYVEHIPEISENSNVDVYAIIKVTDKDTGENGKIKTVGIVDGDPNNYFNIHRTKTEDRYSEYTLSVSSLIKKEDKIYNLKVLATDNGVPERSFHKIITVNMKKLSKHTPIFDKELYEVSVIENSPINTPVLRLKTSSMEQVDVEIVGGNEGGEFYVNKKTGMMYTAKSLDSERKPAYTLTVSAIDNGHIGIRKQSSAKVRVLVTDVNDNSPVFETEDDDDEIYVKENDPVGSYVTKVTAQDRDGGENGYVSYSISNINPVPFEIDHFTGVVTTTEMLDYETMKREWSLYVTASDWGLPYRRQSEKRLKIRLRDINDNKPIFDKVNCSGTLPKSLPINSEIISLTAIDFDSGNIISYRMLTKNTGCFKIDVTSGIVKVVCDLMRAEFSEIVLNVTATDGVHLSDILQLNIKLTDSETDAVSSRSSSSIWNSDNDNFECKETGVNKKLKEILTISNKNNDQNVFDKEDISLTPIRYGENVHYPEFIDFPGSVTVNESTPIGTVISRIHGKDRDLGYNGRLLYGLSGGDNDSVFLIESNSGKLKTIGFLDYERQSRYKLNITIYDQGNPQKSVHNVLDIIVLDVNDNPPVFDDPMTTIRIREDVHNNSIIFKAEAHDVDQGDNAKVQYMLATSDVSELRIDEFTGDVFVFGKLDRELHDHYEIKIRALNVEHGGIQTLYSDCVLRIIVDDVNDNPPIFPTNNFTVKVREDVPVGTMITIITAMDPDVGENGELLYSLKPDKENNDNLFKIDHLTGVVRLTGRLDYEERQLYTLVVRAEDRGTPPLESETNLVVLVTDVNENLHAPQFDEFVMASAVLENQPIGTLVTQVKATDHDPPGDDSRIAYSIRGGDGLGYFSIDNQGKNSLVNAQDT